MLLPYVQVAVLGGVHVQESMDNVGLGENMLNIQVLKGKIVGIIKCFIL